VTNETLLDLLHQVEAAIDASPGLTRATPDGITSSAKFTFSAHGWLVRLEVHSEVRKWEPRYEALGAGETPEQAVASFVERLPYFVLVLT
jgi:hypothetical protein